MSESVLVYEPAAPAGTASRIPTHTLNALKDKTVGFVDNVKPNFDHLVDDLAAILVSKYGVASVVKRRKRGSAVPASQAVMNELVDQCDAVITGSGD